ncbi:penicillin-binding protein 2B [Paenibacillus sp. JCM 10914]|uniref:penicillin-binding transpeptidase domain-containing protein n=1 Tax=Paenibacillus sp. JCM 10914 TaxID=1236974 RepID=UPI0003CC92C7|nr:penicillin-binding transpeptidase domain-containing protein [Paenibacillus sp. JCM 10914]GAE04248.1 3-oxoacyl-[acyl-carrier protein] reductase [Paenibacillus sp. JCM 10914]
MIKKIKLRTLLIGGCITLFFALLIGRVFYLQVMDNEFWKAQALSKWSRSQPLPASRGTIMDRDGDILAMDAPAFTVVVNPKVIQANGLEDDVVKGLHEVLGKKEDELRELVRAKDDKGEFLVNREVRTEGYKIDQEKKAEVDELNESLVDKLKSEGKSSETGIAFIRDKKRFYPKHEEAAHVVGYINREGTAVGGIESFYDEYLQGTDGFASYKSDKKGIKLPSEDDLYQPALNGNNLKLTVDDTIQYYIKEAMLEAVKEYNPVSMTVIAADPNTMEILGMANMPTYDPNTFWEYDMKNFNNHAVRSIYEPGSTFKIVTLASAIEEKLFNPNDAYQSGSIRAGGRTHRDIGSWGPITYLEGVKRSSNVAFVKLGYEILGKERFTNYIRDFGFMEKTQIDLPGESLGILNMTNESDISTMTYGYAVSVTPIQQLAAISTVANGGKLMKAHMVKEIEDPNTGTVQTIEPEMIRQVISPEAARETGMYLEQVVSDQVNGTGRHAYIDGYRVAGKTGTAIKSSTGGYADRSKQLVSFIGYAPVDDPKIAVLVIVDEPNTDKGGGAVAAPIFKNVVSKTLNYWGIPKSHLSEDDGKKKQPPIPENTHRAPDMTGEQVSEVKAKLLEEGVTFELLGSGNTVKQQYPPPGTPISGGQRLYLLTEDGASMKIPHLQGESLRDAMEVLTLMRVKVNVQGEGYVAEQLETSENGQRTVHLTLRTAEELATGKDSEGGTSTDGDHTEDSDKETGNGSDEGE